MEDWGAVRERLRGRLHTTPDGVTECCERCSDIRAALERAIVGGESGPGARPCDVAWVRSIVRQCREAGVACFVKQDSGPRPGMQGRLSDDLWAAKEFPK